MTGKEKFFEQGVSETVGFIIIFGIVMTGIGLVTVYGYPLLLQEQANANIRNMEKNMIVLQSDLNSLTFKNVPYQETTMQVSGGTLYTENPDPLKYFVIRNGTDTVIPSFQPGEIAFRSDTDNVILGLQNGAVVKWQLGGSAMLSTPRWYYDSTTGTLVITLIQVYSDSDLTQTGIGTVSMSVSELYPLVEQVNPGTITIEYHDNNFDYYPSWRNYFNTFAPTSSNIVTITGIDRLVIKSYKVKVISL
jgi:hypothetical protein